MALTNNEIDKLDIETLRLLVRRFNGVVFVENRAYTSSRCPMLRNHRYFCRQWIKDNDGAVSKKAFADNFCNCVGCQAEYELWRIRHKKLKKQGGDNA